VTGVIDGGPRRDFLRLFGTRDLPRCGRCKHEEGAGWFGPLWTCLCCADELLMLVQAQEHGAA
jgi:hypothetical protein